MIKSFSYFSFLIACQSVRSACDFSRKTVLLWLLTLTFSCHCTQNVSEEKTEFNKEFLLKKYQDFDSVFNRNFERMKIKDNSNGLFAWALSYLMDSYVEMYELTGNSAYMKKMAKYTRFILKNSDEKNQKQDYKGRIRSGWGASRYAGDSLWVVYPVHTGMILYPMLKFAWIVKNVGGPVRAMYGGLTDSVVAFAARCMAELDGQWVWNNSKREGYYRWEGDEPIKTDLQAPPPLNSHAALGKVFWRLWELTGDNKFRQKAEGITRYYLNNIEKKKKQYVWGYRAELKKYPKIEDISHGAIEVELVVEAVRAGMIPKKELKGFAATLLHMKKNGYFANYVDGSEDYKNEEDRKNTSMNAGRWLDLAQTDCRVFESVLDVYMKVLKSRDLKHPVEMLGVAKLLKWERRCR